MSRSSSSRSSRGLTVAIAVAGIGVIAVIAVAFLMTQNISSPLTGAREDEPMFADLAEKVEDVQQIRIVGREYSTTLTARNGDWVVEEKDGYPAFSRRVAALLSDIQDLRALDRDEPSAREMADRGVADVEEGGEGLRVSFVSDDGGIVKEFVVGRERSAPGATNLSAFYLRESGSVEVLLIDGALDMPAEPMEWIEESAFELATQRIYEVETAPRDGDSVRARRDMPGEAPYVPGGLPDDRELEGPWVLTELMVPFTSMIFEDVKALPEDAEEREEERGYARTYDGIKIWYSFYPIEDDEGETLDWVYFDIESVDPVVREELDDADEEEAPAAADVVPEGAVSGEEIEARLNGWLFKLPSHTMERLRQNVEGLPTRGVLDDPNGNDLVDDLEIEPEEDMDLDDLDEDFEDPDDRFEDPIDDF